MYLATHNCWHTLDLVITLNLSLNSLNKFDFVFGRKYITFDASLLPSTVTQRGIIHSCIFNKPSAATFFGYFSSLDNCPPHFANSNDLVSWFDQLCTSTLDFSALYTPRAVPVINTPLWINKNISKEGNIGKLHIVGKSLN